MDLGLLGRILGINDPPAQPQPAATGLLGTAQPQVPSFDQYNQDRSSFGGLLSNIFAHGIGPGIGAAIAPDSMAAADYNALLNQGAESGLNNLAYQGYLRMQPQINGNPATAAGTLASAMPQIGPLAAPQMLPQQPPLQSGSMFAPSGSSAPPLQAAAAQPSSASASPGQPAPLFNTADLYQQYRMAAANPKMANVAQQLLSLIEKGVPEGAYAGVDGGIYPRPGYLPFVQSSEAAKAAGGAPTKILESLVSRSGMPLKLEPGDAATTGFQTLPAPIQSAVAGILGGNGMPQASGFPSAGGGGSAPTISPPPIAPRGIAGSNGYPQQSIFGPQGTLQGPTTLEGKTMQSKVLPEIYEKARTQYEAANGMAAQLNMIDRAIDQLNQTGWSATGAGANTKMALFKGINSLEQMFNLSPSFDPSKIATWEDFNKESTRMGFELAKTLGSREAMMIVQQAVGAVPNAENSYLGARLVSSSLRQAAQRQSDFYEFLNERVAGGKTMLGADVAFNKVHPPGEYTDRAIMNAVPPNAIAYLQQHPDTAAHFDETFGAGLAKKVLGK